MSHFSAYKMAIYMNVLKNILIINVQQYSITPLNAFRS